MSKKQQPSETVTAAKALIELNRPLSSFQRDTIAEFLLEHGICNSMGHALAQVKFWSKSMAKKSNNK